MSVCLLKPVPESLADLAMNSITDHLILNYLVIVLLCYFGLTLPSPQVSSSDSDSRPNDEREKELRERALQSMKRKGKR